MLMLLLTVGDERYAVEVKRIIEVVPMAELRRLPRAPECVAGLFHYRGGVVPVVDLCRLTVGKPCARRLSTRIVLMDYPGRDGASHALGLLAERVTETVVVNPDDLNDAGLSVRDAPYLGRVGAAGGQMIQTLELDRLLPEDLRDSLFAEPDTEA